MSNDSSFAAKKKRRRSSLFVERPPNVINESADTHQEDNTEGLKDYITQLKNCKQSWVRLERKLKSQLQSSSYSDNKKREIEDVKNNFTDYLDEEDRAFMKEISHLGSSDDAKSVHRALMEENKEKLRLLQNNNEKFKKECSLLYQNVIRAQKCTKTSLCDGILKTIDANEYETELKKISINDEAPPIIDYNSDLSDFDE